MKPVSDSVAARAAALGLAAAFFSSLGQTFFIGLFGEALREHLLLSPAAFGLIYGMATLGSGVAMFWLGAVADRLTPARALVVALSLLALGSLFMAAAHGAISLFAAFLLLRLAGQGLLGHLSMVFAGRYGAARRGRTVAIAAFGFFIGEALWPGLVVAALLLVDWRVLWVGLAVAVVLFIIPLAHRFARALPAPRQVVADGEIPPAPLRRTELLRDRRFALPLLVLLVSPVVLTAVFFHQSSLAGLLQWRTAWIAPAFTLFAVAQGLSTWLTGMAVDRLGALRVMRWQLLPMAAAMLVMALWPGPVSLWLIFVSVGLTGGANYVVVGALWPECFGVRQLGMVRGVFAAVMVLATAAAPVLLGIYLSAGASLPLLCLSAAAYMLVIPPLVVAELSRVRFD